MLAVLAVLAVSFNKEYWLSLITELSLGLRKVASTLYCVGGAVKDKT